MVRQEWKKLLHNKILLVVILAVIAIPSIYTTLFLGSMWDPYGNTDKLPVAVVNEDQPVEYQGAALDIGGGLVKKLKEEKSLDFHFVEKKEGEQGLKDGTYYMMIRIPEDFSAKAGTLTGEKPEKMELFYETNPGTNYIASKMSETAMKEMESAVCQEVTRTYIQAVMDKVLQAKEGMEQAGQGAGELAAGAETLLQGVSGLSQKAPVLVQGIQEAVQGGSLLQTQGTSVLEQGAETLAEGAEALSQGTSQMAAGTQALKEQVPALLNGGEELSQGLTSLKEGTGSLKAGAAELVENGPSLLLGASQLSQGGEQIGQGAGKLYEGSRELGEGLKSLEQGAGTLKNALEEGGISAGNSILSEEGMDMFADPAVTKETQITEVENNGHAMAPYMMSVGLWVGCIAFSLMYPLTEYSGKLKSGGAWWRSKASVLYLVALLQAAVMTGALWIFDGFRPVQPGKTLLTACLASLAFMSIMYFFTNLLGKAGSFLMLVFMVVQLAGSVGTYPLELSGSFVPYLHDWVPFTYTVTAFRSTISGGESIGKCLLFLGALFLVFSLMTVLEFQIRAGKIKRGKRTWVTWLKAHGLE